MYPAILANVARHITLTAEEAAVFTALLVPQHVTRAGLVVAAGQRLPQLTFVVQGCVRTYATDAQGREHNLAFATEGWWCANFQRTEAPAPTTLALQALEETDVLHLRLNHLEQLCEQVPTFERFFRLLFQNGYLLVQRQAEARLKFTAEVRYAHFLRYYPRLHQRVAQKHIASFLGITPEFLSILRKKRGQGGILKVV
jgi:CRP-like cAMP-binding protein